MSLGFGLIGPAEILLRGALWNVVHHHTFLGGGIERYIELRCKSGGDQGNDESGGNEILAHRNPPWLGAGSQIYLIYLIPPHLARSVQLSPPSI